MSRKYPTSDWALCVTILLHCLHDMRHRHVPTAVPYPITVIGKDITPYPFPESRGQRGEWDLCDQHEDYCSRVEYSTVGPWGRLGKRDLRQSSGARYT